MDGAWEEVDRTLGAGEIAWNTYAHASMPEGWVRVGNESYSIAAADGWRAYADMNWGAQFLDDNGNASALKYAWGWFKAGVPAGAVPGVPELSIIAGDGLDHQVGVCVRAYSLCTRTLMCLCRECRRGTYGATSWTCGGRAATAPAAAARGCRRAASPSGCVTFCVPITILCTH